MESAMLKLLEKIQDIFKFIRENPRYFFAVLIFLAAIFYNQISDVPEIKKNKKWNYNITWQKEKADLDDKNPEKFYASILNSSAGDYYRLGIKIGSVNDEKLRFLVTTPLGEEKEIGSMDISLDNGEKYMEFVFSTDKNYRNLKIRKIKKDGVWRDGNVFIYHLYLSRLDAKNETAIRNLPLAVFGDTRIKKVYAEEYRELPELENKKYIAGAVFSPEGDYIAEAAVNLSKAGVAASKESYQLELRYYGENNQISEEAVKKVVFTADEIAGCTHSDGNCHFEFPVKLKNDKKYFIGISRNDGGSDDIKVSNLENADVDSQFAVSFIDFTKDSKSENILTNARAEDLGNNNLVYHYSNNGNYFDFFDVFEYDGKLKFSKSKKAVVNSAKKGNYFTYKINTVYPIKKARVNAVQLGDKEKQIDIAYSYDNKFWKKLNYNQVKGESQEYDAMISDSGGASAIYLKISYVGKDSDDDFGLEKLAVSAELAR